MSQIRSAIPTPATHRFFYINGKLELGFFTTPETDVAKILADFFKDKDFLSLKGRWGDAWSNLKLIKFDRELNEIHLENKLGKSLTATENSQNDSGGKKEKKKKVTEIKRKLYNGEKKEDKKPKAKRSLI